MSRKNQQREIPIPEPHAFVPMIRDGVAVACGYGCGDLCEECRTCSSQNYHRDADAETAEKDRKQ